MPKVVIYDSGESFNIWPYTKEPEYWSQMVVEVTDEALADYKEVSARWIEWQERLEEMFDAAEEKRRIAQKWKQP